MSSNTSQRSLIRSGGGGRKKTAKRKHHDENNVSLSTTSPQPSQPSVTSKSLNVPPPPPPTSNENTPACAPHSDSVQNKFTCYSNESLEKMKRLWNGKHPDARIESNDPRKIWEQLKQNMQYVCKNEACWLRQNFAKNGLDKDTLNYTFAPESPAEWKNNPTEWLTSLDITNVMKQYEHAYPSFVFIGPSPIDYDVEVNDSYGECVWDELCTFDLNKHMKNGKTKIGVIFNTDPHNKPGSHWISLFIDAKAKYIFFFDSTGFKPPSKVMKFVNTVKRQGEEQGIHFDIIINNVEHQKKNTECGVYSLFMITHMLNGRLTPQNFMDKSTRLNDEYMQRFRKKYFN